MAKILLVEDNEMNRDMLSRRLVRRGYDIVMAVDGEHIESSRGLIRAVAGVAPGNSIRITVRRQGRELEIPVTVGRRPTEQQG